VQISISISNALQKKIIPNYAKIKVQNTYPGAKFTFKKAQTTLIKDENP